MAFMINQSVSSRTERAVTALALASCGSILSVFGAHVGMLLGMMFGAGFPMPFPFGGLPGYEGAGLFGDMVGAAIISFVLIAVLIRPAVRRIKMSIVYAMAWLFATVVQHFVALQTHEWMPPLVIAPIMIAAVAVMFLRGVENGNGDLNRNHESGF